MHGSSEYMEVNGLKKKSYFSQSVLRYVYCLKSGSICGSLRKSNRASCTRSFLETLLDIEAHTPERGRQDETVKESTGGQ